MKIRLSILYRNLLAVSFLAIALLVRLAFDPWLGDVLSHPTIFTATLLATWYCGIGPAILIAVLGYPAIELFILEVPFGSWHLYYLIPALVLYLSLSAIIIAFVTRFRRERDALEATEEKLRESIAQQERSHQKVSLLSKAIESAANSIVLTDRKGVILWVNPAFSELTGYALEEVIGEKPSILKSGRQAADFYTALWETILNGISWHGEIQNKKKDGSIYTEKMTIAPVRAAGNEITHFVSIKEDITARRQLEEALRAATVSSERAKELAEEANKAKDQFLAVLSHELRTPLSPVLAAVQLLQRVPDLSPSMRETLEIIRRNVLLEARLIDDLLDLSRITSGKILLDCKPLDVSEIIQRSAEVCAPDLDARKLNFHVEIQEKPLAVSGDSSRLQQVLWNLVKNSIKFTPDGGDVSIRGFCEDRNVVIEVTDSGVGIEPEDMPKIFNAFEQGDKRKNGQFGGLGLGLAISRRLVEMHGGTIIAKSGGKNQGASFRVSLPAISAVQEIAVPSIKSPSCAAPPSSKRILIVEDHGDSASMLRALLEGSGYEVETAGDVAQALAAIKNSAFDLLLSDLGLPDGTGLAIMEQARQTNYGIKGIALSGYGREEDVSRSRNAGFSAHLTKPVDFDLLEKTVSRILGGD